MQFAGAANTCAATEAAKPFWIVARQSGSVRRDIPIFATRDHAIALEAEGPGSVTRRDFSEGIFLLDNVLHAGECDAIVATSQAMGYTEDAPVSLGRNVRRNENCVWIVDDALNDAVFERARRMLPPMILLQTRSGQDFPVGPVAGLNRRWRLYRYGAGDVFKFHTDGGWPGSGLDASGALVQDLHEGRRYSWLTFLIYLNDDFVGGQTKFALDGREAFAVAPKKGSVLCFLHGHHPLSPLHEGGLVTEGTKYVARTDGPAEPARLALTIGNIDFEDKRVSGDEMRAMRAAGELKGGGQVPQLEVDGEVLSQSQAITQFCGRLAGLYPSDPWTAAKVEEVIMIVNQDIRDRCIAPTMREQDPEKKAAMRKELSDAKLPEKFAFLEALVQPSGYMVGDSLTIADLHVYVLMNWIGMKVLDGVDPVCVLNAAKLKNLCSVLNDHPAIKAWNEQKNAGKVPWF
ncbi:hypothetical protein AURANDRAFT_71137 [Aureococcus anophagefferens]|uniref:Fe2OG dioxygenase domain-containing protein n=1 Tax=Aureococcus anophagefferens TaxID=44056 RepID=F0Y416_AURAN|nr:hypothetical protein AURANDRAFT_71137 [Aureococcus anophagefferens]EGB10473.1 hypothetical protein AURANDRAFT_71137 [Aureococcus anophagefferens]|eukprot:XP_009035266.1 hypothetical protein AURANDRAFT_71137 [Aureococcus anophagefferens]